MATVVPFASCYAVNIHRPLQLFGNGPGGGYLSLLTYHGPRRAPHPRMACHAPKMTLRQICHMLRMMRKMRSREAGPGGMSRKQTSPPPTSELASHQGNREKMPPSLPPSQTQWKYQEGGVTAAISKPHPKLTPNSQWGYSLFDGSIWFMSTTSIQNEKDWHHDHCWGRGLREVGHSAPEQKQRPFNTGLQRD